VTPAAVALSTTSDPEGGKRHVKGRGQKNARTGRTSHTAWGAGVDQRAFLRCKGETALTSRKSELWPDQETQIFRGWDEGKKGKKTVGRDNKRTIIELFRAEIGVWNEGVGGKSVRRFRSAETSRRYQGAAARLDDAEKGEGIVRREVS